LAAAIALIVAAGVLEAIVDLQLVPATTLAPPSGIAGGFVALAQSDQLFRPAFVTLAETVAATLLAGAIGIPLGIWLARRPAFGAAYESWLGALFASPLVLLYPLFLVIFHRTYATIVVMSTLTGVIPIILQTRAGMLAVPSVLKAVGRSFSLPARKMFWLIELPAAVPSIATGVRLGIIYALVNTIGVEFLIDFGGLGRIVSDMYASYDIPQMYAGIVTIVAISLALLAVLDRAERWLRPA
jgi:ABC-type nitrate/sulfonate/bicarbonate transport system permease component